MGAAQKQLKPVTFVHHLCIGIVSIKENQAITRECYVNARTKAAKKPLGGDTIFKVEKKKHMVENPLRKASV